MARIPAITLGHQDVCRPGPSAAAPPVAWRSAPGGGLRNAVRGWAAALAGDDQYRNPDLVRQQLAARKLQGRNAIEAYSRIAIASP